MSDTPAGSSPGPLAPAGAVAAPAQPSKPERYFASVLPGLDTPLPDEYAPMAKAVLEYEKITGRPAWLILQSDTEQGSFHDITPELASTVIMKAGEALQKTDNPTVILHTAGGSPEAAFRLGTYFQKHYDDFNVLVPRMAKSAGTLFALAADKIIMGDMAELGPLDMQVRDPETEIWDSALNETKALQTLSREALVLYTAKMDLLRNMYRHKRFETRSKIATDFVNEMIKPLVDKIDAVHYTKMARVMEIMKKYGRELMSRAGYSREKVARVVEALGEDYPDHSYIIDHTEARRIGLRIFVPRIEAVPFVATIANLCGETSIIGRISVS